MLACLQAGVLVIDGKFRVWTTMVAKQGQCFLGAYRQVCLSVVCRSQESRDSPSQESQNREMRNPKNPKKAHRPEVQILGVGGVKSQDSPSQES
jgi:hypothetical protein